MVEEETTSEQRKYLFSIFPSGARRKEQFSLAGGSIIQRPPLSLFTSMTPPKTLDMPTPFEVTQSPLADILELSVPSVVFTSEAEI